MVSGLGPLVNSEAECRSKKMGIPEGGGSRNRMGGARAGCINWLQDDMAMEKKKRVH